MQSIEILEKLISFPTVSKDSNLDLIKFVEGYLVEHGISSKRVPNKKGTKANLYATIGPMEEGGIILSGHTDVVPVEGQPWDTDPFVLTEKEDRLYGRGTCDMKAYAAIALSLIPQMKNLKKPWGGFGLTLPPLPQGNSQDLSRFFFVILFLDGFIGF